MCWFVKTGTRQMSPITVNSNQRVGELRWLLKDIPFVPGNIPADELRLWRVRPKPSDANIFCSLA